MSFLEIDFIFYFCSVFLFTTGLFLVITRKNPIFMLIGIELMLNAANVNLVSWSSGYEIKGQVISLFVIVLAVCETSLALAIIYHIVHRTNKKYLESTML